MSENKSEQYRVKSLFQKFRKHFLIGAGVVMVFILIFTFIKSGNTTTKKVKVKASDVYTAAKPLPVSQSDIVAQRLDELTAKQDNINQANSIRIASLESQVKQTQLEKEQAESQAAALNAKLATLNSGGANSGKKNASANLVAKAPQSAIFEDNINADNPDSDATFEKSAKTAAAAQKSDDTQSTTKGKAEPDKLITTYIPSNTYAPGVLIASMAANTGGNASSDPTPGLIRITDMASLPNEFTSRLRSCRVGVSGFGDLSSERIKMRTTTLSCVLKNGKAIDIPVEGYVDGEDSKAGLKGMVITHSGTMAAKATLAGFVQGIGQIGQAMGQTQTITPLGGVTTTISPDQAITAGVGSGISQAGQTLSQYYLNMLNQISPTIEVAAGRHVTVIFTKGIELKLPINAQDSGDTNPLPIN